jgi:drug/metabolite transporter (DMT)-like permease
VALTAGLVAPLTWGLTGVFVRLLHGVPTLAIVDVRLLIAALVLSPWAFRRRHAFRDALRSPLAFAMGAYYIFATEAFARAPAGRRDFAVKNSYALQGDAQVLLVSTDEAGLGFSDQ